MVDSKVILLVDDNPDDVLLTIRALKKSKVSNEIIITSDGIEALDFLFAQGKYTDHDINKLPAVVLLDLKMPRMDGLEVLRRIRADERTKFLPVVILTCSKEEEDLINSYKLGANSFIHKPVDWNRFAKAIRTLGMYWVVMNEPIIR